MTEINLKYFNNNEGFSLIEIISVLLILGVISATVLTKSGSFTSMNDLTMEAETLKANLRYTQMMSMNASASEPWRLKFITSDTEYKIQQYNSGTTSWDDKNLPGHTSSTHTFASGITATVSPATRYNNLGVPIKSDLTTLQTTDKTITLSKSGNTASVTITKNTGFTFVP